MFHEHCLLSDESYEILYLILLNFVIWKDVAKFCRMLQS